MLPFRAQLVGGRVWRSQVHTPRPRVHAAGDACTYPGTVTLTATATATGTGFGEAATAVNNLAVELDPGAHVFPGYSSGV